MSLNRDLEEEPYFFRSFPPSEYDDTVIAELDLEEVEQENNNNVVGEKESELTIIIKNSKRVPKRPRRNKENTMDSQQSTPNSSIFLL